MCDACFGSLQCVKNFTASNNFRLKPATIALFEFSNLLRNTVYLILTSTQESSKHGGGACLIPEIFPGNILKSVDGGTKINIKKLWHYILL